MKTISQLTIPKEVNSDFPYGAIINETETNEGTPVIREIYNDLLSNVYKLLALAGINPNGNEDNETNGHQIIEAIRLLPNNLNDVQRTLSLSGTVFTVDMNLSLLPNDYVFIARAGDNYNASLLYTIKGNEVDGVEYPFASPMGFKSGDDVLVILDQSIVRVISLTLAVSERTELTLPFGTPIAYNNTKLVYYLDGGILMTDSPLSINIQSYIRTQESDSSVLVLNAFVLKGKLLCFCFSATDSEYYFYEFDLTDLSAGQRLLYVIDNSNDYKPYCYSDGNYVFLTNDANTSSSDFLLRRLKYNANTGTISNNSTFTLENTFVKTTNVVMKSDALISFIGGSLVSFALGTPTKTLIGVFTGNSGNIFVHNRAFYYSVGQVAVKWTL